MTSLCLGLLFASGVAFADDSSPVGWHWYNYVESPLADQKPAPNVNNLTPTQTMQEIQKGYQEALTTASLYPTEQNVARYLEMQEWIENQSADFAAMHPKVLLDYPQLDNRIEHPTEQIATQLVGEQQSVQEQAALKELVANNGILFFYEGANQLDELMCQVVSQFAAANQIAIIPISVDGKISEFFPNSRVDSGQAAKLGIRYFPATILVNPETDQSQPVAYGFLTQDELLQRFLLSANDFKPSYIDDGAGS